MAQSKTAKAAVEGVMSMAGVPDDQVGLGVDIVEIARMKAILARTKSFAARVFSDEERAYCDGKATPEIHYATRFAAKEAVLKALGTGFSAGIGVRDIEVRRSAKGRPYVVLHGRAKAVAHAMGVRELPISLSYTHTEAVACAMAITEGSVRAAEERVDPMRELALQFKEVRGILDDIDAPKGAQERGVVPVADDAHASAHDDAGDEEPQAAFARGDASVLAADGAARVGDA